jgi:exopolyphosphatase/guanosine-5'-triphosphate,3'-diphosphate pyrophosphatase
MRAVISLGTNTARLLVVRDVAEGEVAVVEHRQIGTRLGEGLRDEGALAPAAAYRTLAAVAEFTDVAREHGAELECIATSALRRASDAADFAERVSAIAGATLRVLPGDLEATMSFFGATHGAPHDGARTAVVDVGGGSTECAVGRDGRLEAARSVEIGSVRVAERFPALGGSEPGAPARAAAAAARAEIAAMLAPFADLRPVDRVRSVAGTALTLGAVFYGRDVEDVTGLELSRGDLDATITRLLDLALAPRRGLPGMVPQRADILPAGGLVLSELLRLLDAKTCVLETSDLLLGFLLLDRPAKAD